MENAFTTRLDQRQTQNLTPVQLHSLNLLATPLAELETQIAAELAANPLLEIAPPAHEELAGDPLGEVSGAELAPDAPAYDGDEEDFSRLSELAEVWHGDGSSENGGAGDEEESAAADDYGFSALTAHDTLAESLAEQLRFAALPEREREVAEAVLGSIDEHGYLATHPADIAMAGGFSLAEVERAIALVQSFDPPGVGAKDAAESLALQLRRKGETDERLYRLLTECRDDLEHNRLPNIARHFGVEVSVIYTWLEKLRTLNPVPAAGLAEAAPALTAIPEMAIEWKAGKLEVVHSNRSLPHLSLVSRYLKMLEDPATPEDAKAYLREKLAAAEALLKALELRQSTLERITEVIARRQEAFFRDGLAALVPMTMTEVAAELGVHDTTVSRAVADKYLATPQGLLEYRFFFTSGVTNEAGEEVSSRAVKAALQALIEDEDPHKPLSDAALAEALTRQGTPIARRTVAKYRESLGIPATSLRKRH